MRLRSIVFSAAVTAGIFCAMTDASAAGTAAITRSIGASSAGGQQSSKSTQSARFRLTPRRIGAAIALSAAAALTGCTPAPVTDPGASYVQTGDLPSVATTRELKPLIDARTGTTKRFDALPTRYTALKDALGAEAAIASQSPSSGVVGADLVSAGRAAQVAKLNDLVSRLDPVAASPDGKRASWLAGTDEMQRGVARLTALDHYLSGKTDKPLQAIVEKHEYALTIETKDSSFTLDIGEHIKNAASASRSTIAVDQATYVAATQGGRLSSDFKTGSLVGSGPLKWRNASVVGKNETVSYVTSIEGNEVAVSKETYQRLNAFLAKHKALAPSVVIQGSRVTALSTAVDAGLVEIVDAL